MKEKDKLEIARSLLNNAASMNLSKQTLLRISQKVDQYILEYYRKNSRTGSESGGGSAVKTGSSNNREQENGSEV